MKSLWSTLRPRVTNTSLKSQSQTQKTNYSVLETCTHGTARSIGNHSPRSLPSSLHNTLSDRNDRNTETERKTEKETVELCQMFLNKLNRACAAFIGWADELEENCVALNDEIAKDKDRYREGAGLRYCTALCVTLFHSLILFFSSFLISPSFPFSHPFFVSLIPSLSLQLKGNR